MKDMELPEFRKRINQLTHAMLKAGEASGESHPLVLVAALSQLLVGAFQLVSPRDQREGSFEHHVDQMLKMLGEEVKRVHQMADVQEIVGMIGAGGATHGPLH